MAILLVHGAGSSGAAATTLLAPLLRGHDVVCVEDRSGDVDAVTEAVGSAMDAHADVTHVIGVSLGAHAVAHWAALPSTSSAGQDPPRTCFILPAWLGTPGPGAAATAQAGENVGSAGIPATLRRLRSDFPASASPAEDVDVVGLVEMAWADYDDATLAAALRRAATTAAPTPAQLTALTCPAAVVGWENDPLHPSEVTRAWARSLPGARVAVASQPSVRLLRMAVATATDLG